MFKMFDYEVKETEDGETYFTENGFVLSPTITVKKLNRLQHLESELSQAKQTIEEMKVSIEFCSGSCRLPIGVSDKGGE